MLYEMSDNMILNKECTIIEDQKVYVNIPYCSAIVPKLFLHT